MDPIKAHFYTIKAHVADIRGNRMGDRSEKITVCASYEAASIISSITFEAPIEDAPKFYVGQEISVIVSWETPPQA
ncbi:hypothetical protein LCGC14_0984980 [marine sediment metagenome]|uniref:Uncharacterized protein n=1 Tax=marine sediment metagenome TaxID=412755 RepID=A0A0F9RE48_9ZZZZ